MSKLDRYPIPRIKDLFARLAGGKAFTKLDFSQAYQQLVLEEESREYVVINTHKGLFRYVQPSAIWGVLGPRNTAKSNGIYIGQHPQGGGVYLDDILITAPTEEEHLA